jgi:hypothetical protein
VGSSGCAPNPDPAVYSVLPMQRAAVTIAGAVGVVVVTILIIAWREPRPELTAADARRFTEQALHDIGFAQVKVSARVESGSHRPGRGGDAVAVWRTTAAVDGGTVELAVARSRGRAAFLRDVTADGSARLLTAEQVRQLDRFTFDRPLDDQVRRNMLATVDGLGIVALAVLLALDLTGRRDQPRVWAPSGDVLHHVRTITFADPEELV